MQSAKKINNSNQPLIDLGGEGDPLLFSHANGYPPLCYKSMLTPLLPTSRVYAGLFRPLWQPEVEPSSVNSWETFAEDLIAVIDSEIQQPVIGVGHSMGAVSSLIAAVKRPDLFTSVVLIEPVLVPQRYLVFLRLFSRLSPRRIPMVRIALARKDS